MIGEFQGEKKKKKSEEALGGLKELMWTPEQPSDNQGIVIFG